MKCRLTAASPHIPDGPFPRDEIQDRSFSNIYYHLTTNTGLKLNIHWLCYSMKLDCVYCLPCRLFPQQQKAHTDSTQTQRISTSGVRGWKAYKNAMKNPKAMLVLALRMNSRANMGQMMTQSTEHLGKKDTSGRRILNVTFTLYTCNLTFRETREYRNKGNFLSIIELLSKYDPVLQELLLHLCCAVKYLCPEIQNELIDLLS
ncbi:hypothetical protein PR048_016827 [Dryococelus australis]|uniref:Uncharacterized protein n=1 Tax=Dryococelus australis TaxID=614101 RepID=A0ABQ9H8C3_9NEOP|nr:hypothetical protein PR048_016827 [Dryococelus australis]